MWEFPLCMVNECARTMCAIYDLVHFQALAAPGVLHIQGVGGADLLRALFCVQGRQEFSPTPDETAQMLRNYYGRRNALWQTA